MFFARVARRLCHYLFLDAKSFTVTAIVVKNHEDMFIPHPHIQAVTAWAKAHPNVDGARQPRVMDALDAPVLRSTRNALGVLAGGGEADLHDGGDDSAEVAYEFLKELINDKYVRGEVCLRERFAPFVILIDGASGEPPQA